MSFMMLPRRIICGSDPQLMRALHHRSEQAHPLQGRDQSWHQGDAIVFRRPAAIVESNLSSRRHSASGHVSRFCIGNGGSLAVMPGRVIGSDCSRAAAGKSHGGRMVRSSEGVMYIVSLQDHSINNIFPGYMNAALNHVLAVDAQKKV
ncbi:unnamed protein product [Zymoseptoria tritici ST99CH_3D1]|uniref:Uncharacterized protein n=2 Tax=Zymoseptoria tritici TaxID=1047171 RepID=A0A1X7RC86_ZYMT9|nr:unnamed protein product [Zymoseptoria tritici ST99CH_3D7]SMR41394.1 unnamed protein product [Zymoseptoria tritici ST99CH_1E4]SMR43594.1 unnamed protein product [Zymoseptoria tritici ST99CH_3D1]